MNDFEKSQAILLLKAILCFAVALSIPIIMLACGYEGKNCTVILSQMKQPRAGI